MDEPFNFNQLLQFFEIFILALNTDEGLKESTDIGSLL
jgi:hypothetical protein